ncbi:MAG: terpene cyclase/mutase family protein [Candidatus Levybacteria bacterium]|nr:terpene cyclase/mutase family protein [Candidatus Levybacteria bacterium]
MKKFLIIILFLFSLSIPHAYAEEAYVTNGLNFLRAKQDVSGKITTGFSAPSQWSAIAFVTHGVNPNTVKNPTVSLYDFLLADIPSNDNATEWETRILTIAAMKENPFNFNGTNYVAHLETFYNNNQIGDTCSLNDDIFGLLALIASGTTSSTAIKQDVLHFLIINQDTADGGFGYSAPGCSWYSTSADMTGAALQALIAAKNTGLIHPDLANAIDRAKQYLFVNQNADGGFGYFGNSDTDTTGWVLIALNAADLKDEEMTINARNYLLAQQSTVDGGFLAFDYGVGSFVSNASTTAQSLIALSGNSWIVTIYDGEAVAAPITTITPSPTQTVTPTPTPVALTSVSQDTIFYQTITMTTTPSPKKIVTKQASQQTIAATKAVLGDKKEEENKEKNDLSIPVSIIVKNAKNPGFLAIGIGSLVLAIYFLLRSFRKNPYPML